MAGLIDVLGALYDEATPGNQPSYLTRVAQRFAPNVAEENRISSTQSALQKLAESGVNDPEQLLRTAATTDPKYLRDYADYQANARKYNQLDQQRSAIANLGKQLDAGQLTPQQYQSALARMDPEFAFQLAGKGAPAALRVADALGVAQAGGDKRRLDNILLGGKLLEKGTTMNPQGETEVIPGFIPATQSIESGQEFAKKTGQKAAESFVDKREKADQANLTLASNLQARALLDQGIITGTGAEFLVNTGKALKRIGFSVAEDDIANTEAFMAQRAQEVGRIIKLFGAGTGLSDADREFALKAAAGQINLDEKSIRRILDISDKVANEAIGLYQDELSRVPQTALPYDMSVGNPQFSTVGQAEADAGKINTNTPFKGEIVDGYEFLGGNPADQKSWRRAQ